MSDQDLEIFDQHDKEVDNIIYMIKRLANQPVAQTYANKPPLQAIAHTLRGKDESLFTDLLNAMKKIERDEPTVPGSNTRKSY